MHWYCSDPLIQHFSRSDKILELKKFSVYVSTLSLNTSPACSCGTLHCCPWHPRGRSRSTSMAQPFHFCSFHSDLWCYQDGKAEWICSTWWYTRLGVIYIQRATVLGWYFGEDKGESRQQYFWQGFVVQKEEATYILLLTQCCGKQSCCNLWLHKWWNDEWKQPCIFMIDTLVLGPVPASTF